MESLNGSVDNVARNFEQMGKVVATSVAHNFEQMGRRSGKGSRAFEANSQRWFEQVSKNFGVK